MSVFNPQTEFALFLTGNSDITDFTSFFAKTRAMPALDFVLSGLVAAGLFDMEVSETAPASTLKIWVDPNATPETLSSAVKIYNAEASAWQTATLPLFAKLIERLTSGEQHLFLSADANATSQAWHIVDTSAGGVTIDLSALVTSGNYVYISDAEGTFDINNVTLTHTAGDTINGAASPFIVDVRNSTLKLVRKSSGDWSVIKFGV